MPLRQYANNAKSTLAVAVTTNSQATLQVQSGAGALFPAPLAPFFFNATLDDGTNVEIVRCVSIAGDVLTVLRGVEGTTAQSSFAIGTKLELRLTADDINKIQYDSCGLQSFGIRPVTGVQSWQPQGMVLPTVVNGTSAATLTGSSWRTQNARTSLASTNTAQVPAHWRVPQPVVANANGFRALWRFGFPLVPNSSHCFIGWINSTGQPSSVMPPTSMTNMIGVGWANAGSLQGTFLNLYWAGSGTNVATYFSFGSLFNVNTQAWYEFELNCQPGGNYNYALRRLDISSIADVASYIPNTPTLTPGSSLWLSPLLHATTMVNSQITVDHGGIAVFT